MNVTRRELLGTVPAAMAGAWALAGGLAARQAAQALVPARLGVQLYTVRDQLKTLDATLGRRSRPSASTKSRRCGRSWPTCRRC